MPATEFSLKLVEFATALVGLATGAIELYKTGQQDANLQIEGRRRKVRVRIVTASFVVILGIAAYSAFSTSFLYTSLELQDPVVFHPGSNNYRVARVFPNTTELHDEGRFEAVLNDAKRDFEIDAISAHEMLKNYTGTIENMLARGVEMRFLLFDAKADNQKNCESLASVLNRTCEKLERNLEDSLSKLREIHAAVPNGRLEVKTYKTIHLKNFWIKDRGAHNDSVIEVEVHDVRDVRRVAFRVGRLDGGNVLEDSLDEQFNEQWSDQQTHFENLTNTGAAHR